MCCRDGVQLQQTAGTRPQSVPQQTETFRLHAQTGEWQRFPVSVSSMRAELGTREQVAIVTMTQFKVTRFDRSAVLPAAATCSSRVPNDAPGPGQSHELHLASVET